MRCSKEPDYRYCRTVAGGLGRSISCDCLERLGWWSERLAGARRGRGLLPHEHPALLARPPPVPAGQSEKLSLYED